jgi:hypothetical protein
MHIFWNICWESCRHCRSVWILYFDGLLVRVGAYCMAKCERNQCCRLGCNALEWSVTRRWIEFLHIKTWYWITKEKERPWHFFDGVAVRVSGGAVIDTTTCLDLLLPIVCFGGPLWTWWCSISTTCAHGGDIPIFEHSSKKGRLWCFAVQHIPMPPTSWVLFIVEDCLSSLLSQVACKTLYYWWSYSNFRLVPMVNVYALVGICH